ncbi:Uncharacterized protein DBV15_07606 [Temnothorax longispinosus]|uniref:Uncharacterized protein n=1 Tax=Temnothorax longispinosus TaxID=300112 RepID=A0A4S2KEW1_9HYME|nr:Uncharacterized protein DBV15_07606 [Temnothorax longispinosus]
MRCRAFRQYPECKLSADPDVGGWSSSWSMYRTEFITPWMRMRGWEASIRNEMKRSSVAEPSTERHSTTYFDNRKREERRRIGVAGARSAYDRLHGDDVIPFDPSKPRCDRTKPSFIWARIHEEDKRHVVPMTANHWYGRPNRVQIDYPDMRFARSSKTRDFYSRNHLILTPDP